MCPWAVLDGKNRAKNVKKIFDYCPIFVKEQAALYRDNASSDI